MNSKPQNITTTDKHCVQERRMTTYPAPKFHALITAYASANEMRKSEAIQYMIKDFFDRMPEEEKRRIISKSKHSY